MALESLLDWYKATEIIELLEEAENDLGNVHFIVVEDITRLVDDTEPEELYGKLDKVANEIVRIRKKVLKAIDKCKELLG